MEIKILYIDDDINNLISFKANLRHKYTIFLCDDVNNVWDILNKNQDIRIVFSDQRMPIKNGIEILKDIKRCFPNIIRVLLSGYTDRKDIIDGINDCHLYKYIEKPFNFEEIEQIIESSNKYYLSKNFFDLKIEANEEVDKQEMDTLANREVLIDKLILINNLIRDGYQITIDKLGDKYNEYLHSIKNSNYYAVKQELISEIKHII